MMNYTTLAELKTYLSISWTDNDDILNSLLDSTYSLINNLLKIDSFNLDSYTDSIDLNYLYIDWTVFLKNYPVIWLTTINWISYTGVLNTDYKVVNNRQVIINDVWNYLLNLNFNFVDINYTSWYDRDEIKTLDNSAAVDAWGWEVTIPLTANWYSADETITLSWTINYDWTYTIISVTTDTFNITATYNAETFVWTETSTNTVPWSNDELPDDIKLMQQLLVWWFYNKKGSEWIKSYSIWEESIIFGGWDKTDYTSFLGVFNTYKKAYVL